MHQVTSLSEYDPSDCHNSSEKRRKREPQKLSKLIQLVDKATRNFLAVGEEIAHENPDFQVCLYRSSYSIQVIEKLIQPRKRRYPCIRYTLKCPKVQIHSQNEDTSIWLTLDKWVLVIEEFHCSFLRS